MTNTTREKIDWDLKAEMESWFEVMDRRYEEEMKARQDAERKWHRNERQIAAVAKERRDPERKQAKRKEK
jgi:hypothetical protein